MVSTTKSTVTSKSVYLTSEGLIEAKNELDYLKNKKRLEVAERIQNAREDGGVSENSEYDAAIEEQSMVEAKISELEAVIHAAKIIKGETKSDIVTIGSTVKVDMGGQIDEFTIVGRVEANPSKKKISNESPVGSALIGSKQGEVVDITTSIIKYKVKVLEVK